MKKKSESASVWDTPAEPAAEPTLTAPPVRSVPTEPLFDLEGLMTDFPTARELEQFVYDQTGYVLNLKGRSNRFKYQTAMDVLNGQTPDDYLLGAENPYLDKNDIIPMDKLRDSFPIPEQVTNVPMITMFQTRQFPHPDPDWKAAGQKCDVVFKKYINNVITYEIIGPVASRAVGTRVNKFGKEVPEKYEWVDPRQGEQVIRDVTGQFTPVGTRLRTAMQKQKVNKTDWWTAWIDRDFVIGGNNASIDDPWGSN